MASTTKLDLANKLCYEKEKDHQAFLKGLNVLEQLAISRSNTKERRLDAIKTLYKYDKDFATNVLVRILDMIQFLVGDEEETNEDYESEFYVITNVASYEFVPSHYRLLCAVCLYNNHFIFESMTLFYALVQNTFIIYKYRIEACMYLIYSEDQRYRDNVIGVLVSMIRDKTMSDKIRYEDTICKFNSKLGLNTIMNLKSLNVSYDENLLYTLQTVYFFDEENDVRYRILSGQHLLQMSCLSEEEREEIGHKLLNLAENFQDPELALEENNNIQADAADVVIRLGTKIQKQQAKNMIEKLGYFEVQSTGKKVSLLTHRGLRSYIADSQNVHNKKINKLVNQFISRLVEENQGKEIESYVDVSGYIKDIIYELENKSDRLKALKSLGRISIDTATFTNYDVNSADVMVYIWRKIQELRKKFPPEIIHEINNRLAEELIDMANTCATGHAARLINIFSGFNCGMDIQISFDDQLVANIGAIMQTKIKAINDDTLRDQIICGMMENSEPDDQRKCLEFISTEAPLIKESLHEEFVIPGYLSEEKYNKIFDKTVNRWLSS